MGRNSKAVPRRQEILYHFYQVIQDEGFEGASIAKIAKRMEVNPSLLIHYFSNKQAMVLGLVKYIVQTYAEKVLPDLTEVSNPKERWEDLLDVIAQTHWDLFINNTVFYTAYTLSFRIPEIKQEFTRLYEDVRQRLENEIQLAKNAGVISVQDCGKAADLIFILLEGANYYQNVREGVLSMDERSELIKSTIRTSFSHGVV
ncbi:MAG: TetR/AcrR family transcriptional regulator [Bacteroidota bacterium]